jgi:hypothetical protein
MALGLTKSEIQEVLGREIIDELIVKYNTESEEPPQLSYILAMRDLIVELIVLNNEQIEAQLSNMRVSFS